MPKRFSVVAALLALCLAVPTFAGTHYRELPLSVYRDKLMASWLGQMIGVTWGAPVEFQFMGVEVPANRVPVWNPQLVNGAFDQDDLYVEMTFLRSLEQHGLGVSQRQAGLDWAQSQYRLWHANDAGRSNLRRGIAPPDSGHPKFNSHADDIDYQIESDFSGLVSPGLPNSVIALGDKFGHLMNHGDGVYAGQFMGAMYSEAFFEADPAKIVAAALRCVPAQSQLAECVRDVVKWHARYPDDWERTWREVEYKYYNNPQYRRFCCSGTTGKFDIDAKLNCAYVVIGLLYGHRDLAETATIAMRCGQDSDCNPSSAAGVLCAALGCAAIPAQYKQALDQKAVFSYTAYTFPQLLAASEQVARESVLAAGGRIKRTAKGEEVFMIPEQAPVTGALEQSCAPGPPTGSRFTEAELAQLKAPAPK